MHQQTPSVRSHKGGRYPSDVTLTGRGFCQVLLAAPQTAQLAGSPSWPLSVALEILSLRLLFTNYRKLVTVPEHS